MHNTKSRALSGAAIVAVALTVAACGSSSSSSSASSSSSSSAAPAASASSSGASSAGAKLTVAKGKDGSYLAGPNGHALYMWMGDKPGKSNCTGGCAGAWPPLTTSGAPVAGSGVVAADLGTIKRSDGSMQVTYKGHPLYYFSGDSAAGQINGEGSDGFGARWWLVSPAGSPITTGTAHSSSSSSGGAYGY
ncbi:MAG TPA: hypothetical protein VKV27_12370 [Solirubrobacteraceae bacterium]|nr:hypothetical protein [Solirubrobacteraceae bacterium]